MRQNDCAFMLSFTRDPTRVLSKPQAMPSPAVLSFMIATIKVRGRVGHTGTRVTRHEDQIDPETMDAFSSPRCASVDGFSVHANVSIPAGDRQRLERVAQYCARGPVAIERLEPLPDGRLLYRFKRAWRDGTTTLF